MVDYFNNLTTVQSQTGTTNETLTTSSNTYQKDSAENNFNSLLNGSISDIESFEESNNSNITNSIDITESQTDNEEVSESETTENSSLLNILFPVYADCQIAQAVENTQTETQTSEITANAIAGQTESLISSEILNFLGKYDNSLQTNSFAQPNDNIINQELTATENINVDSLTENLSVLQTQSQIADNISNILENEVENNSKSKANPTGMAFNINQNAELGDNSTVAESVNIYKAIASDDVSENISNVKMTISSEVISSEVSETSQVALKAENIQIDNKNISTENNSNVNAATLSSSGSTTETELSAVINNNINSPAVNENNEQTNNSVLTDSKIENNTVQTGENISQSNNNNSTSEENLFNNSQNNTENFDGNDTENTVEKNIASLSAEQKTSKSESTDSDNSLNNMVGKRVKISELPQKTVQLVSQTANNTVHTAQLVLEPQSLGTVFVKIELVNNSATLNFTAENNDVLKSIEGQISVLKEMLSDKGIHTSSVNVTLKSQGSDIDDSSNFQQSTDRQTRKEERDAKNEYMKSFTYLKNMDNLVKEFETGSETV